MEKIIDGKTYKEVPIKKMIVNGKEINGNVIKAEYNTKDGEIRVGIVVDNTTKNKKENEE